MLNRKIESSIIKWIQKDTKALLIDGARQVGKTSVIRKVFEESGCEYIEFNLIKSPELINLLANSESVDDMITNLSLFTDKPFIKGKTFIFIDEIQEFKEITTKVKFWVDEGSFRYIFSGSLLGVELKNITSAPVGYLKTLTMYPMDFEEFLWAMGDEQMMPFIRDCYEKKQALGPLHRKVMDYFRHYMIVGGMPQAVLEYVETHDFMKVDMVKRNILSLYKADIEKYAVGNEIKVKAIFEEIPSALSKHEKKFRLAAISDKARYREYESSFFWLAESRVVNICYNSTAPDIGLQLNEERTTLKCYLADTGLLISHAFNLKTIMGNELYLKLALGKLELNEGMLVENVVAQMLRASGYELFFFSKNSATSAEDRMEIDFLIPKPVITNRHNISPIEVKSGKSFTTTSLNKLRAKFAPMLAEAYVLHPGDVEEKDGVIYLPLYMTGLL